MFSQEGISTRNQRKVLLIGDAMLDVFQEGTPKECPECDIDFHVVGGKQTYRIGGSANVFANLSAMGCTGGYIFGVNPNDESGIIFIDEVIRLNSSFNMSCLPIETTTTKKRFVGNNSEILFRTSSECKAEVDREEFEELVEYRIGDRLPEAIVISDYDKGILNEHAIGCIFSAKAGLDIPILVNPKFENVAYYREVDLMVLNQKEISKFMNEHVLAKGKDIRQIKDELGIHNLVVTKAGDGAVIYDDDGYVEVMPSKELEVIDPSGAGDTFFSVLCALWGKVNLIDSVSMACEIASECVRHVGNYVPDPYDFESKVLAFQSKEKTDTDMLGICSSAFEFREAI